MMTAIPPFIQLLLTKPLKTVRPEPEERQSTTGVDRLCPNGIPVIMWTGVISITLLLSTNSEAQENLHDHHDQTVKLQNHVNQANPVSANAAEHSHSNPMAKPDGSAPANARDPNAYSDGYERNPLSELHMRKENFGSVIVDRLESVTARGETSLTYDWQAWYGGSYDKALIRAEGEIEAGSFFNARNELLWAHAVTPNWDTQLGLRYDSGRGAERGWLAFGIQGLTPYWVYTEATAYINEQGRISFRLELEYDWLLTQKLILQPRVEMNFYSRDDFSRGINSGLSGVEAGLRLRYEITREFAPYLGVEWASANRPSTQNVTPNGSDELRLLAGIRFWI